MGAPMALNLAHAGFQVRAWNRTADTARARLSAGNPRGGRNRFSRRNEVEVCAEPSHAVAGADAVVPMLSDGASVESVMRDGKALSAIGGPIGPAYAQLKGNAMIQRSFEAAFPLVHACKDAALVIEASEANGLEPRVAKAVRDHFDIAIDAGHGDEDMAAAYYAYTPERNTTKGAG